MNIYIPFNSIDFNNIFSTNSISPRSFYNNRKYSFKRATETLLNPFDDFLLAYSKPFFSQKDTDKNGGYLIYIKIEKESISDISEISIKEFKNMGVTSYVIPCTVFLYTNYKLIFRREIEKKEVFASSLRSIETKYVKIAEVNSLLAQDDIDYIKGGIKKFKYKAQNNYLCDSTYSSERIKNRAIGAFVCSALASCHNMDPDQVLIGNIIKKLENTLCLYASNIDREDKSIIKASINELLDILLNSLIKDLNFSEFLCIETNSSIVSLLAKENILGESIIDLLKIALLQKEDLDLPLFLLVEKLKINIDLKFNVKKPDQYLNRITSCFIVLKKKFEQDIVNSEVKELNVDSFLDINMHHNSISCPDIVSKKDTIYWKAILEFFIFWQDIRDIEYLHINRQEITINLGNFLKNKIQEFNNSFQRKNLGFLLKSYDDMRGGFNVNTFDLESLQSVSLLFTTGRDLSRYIEESEKYSINKTVSLSIWGAVYGFASLPKTLTNELFNSTEKYSILNDAIRKIIISHNTEIPFIVNKIPEFIESEKIDYNIILAIVEKNGEIKIKDLISILKKNNKFLKFKKVNELVQYIKKDTNELIKIKKEINTFIAYIDK